MEPPKSVRLEPWPWDELAAELRSLQSAGKKIVFTNGVFDLIHPGHIRYLREAASLGDRLIVALNDDDSVKRLKGSKRPLIPGRERAKIVASLDMVSYVTLFSDDTPLPVIETLKPDVLAKGGDYSPDQIVGRDCVENGGGKVLSLPFEEGFSSSGIVDRILRSSGERNRSETETR
jgi:rfaE bifunctional protein nucleotidyltransferase chain/domain